MEKKNNNSNSTTIIVILSVLVGVLLVVALFFGFLVFNNSKVNGNKGGANNNQPDVTEKEESKQPIELSVSDSVAIELFDIANIVSLGGELFENLYTNEKLLVSQMKEGYKAFVAARIFEDKVISSNTYNSLVYVAESDVKSAYERAFGEGYYNKSLPVYYYCMDLSYDASNSRFSTTWIPCGYASGRYAETEMIRAVKYADRIEITSVVWFVTDGNISKDLEGTQKIDVVYGGNSDSAIESSRKAFIDTYKDQLQQYTYTFKLNEKGVYNYYSIERVN